MPFHSMATLQEWVEEFERLGFPTKSSIRVMVQDGADGADTGLVAMRLPDSPTEIYIEPPESHESEWKITFEPREDTVTLGASSVQTLARELATLSALCSFLQNKSDGFPRPGDGRPDTAVLAD
ncbi:hypothetical protein G5T42_11755 [Microbacterium sp. 4R-513]|uniref:hypothetical protein n=1 Tax=Microbacterium sp. 4R-513 TaxID=2567934 RepID=UPI0013E14C71|nr:hypothetical protein [Microbacterium sp. 4R-513]QIG40073.1 hypothetical protein G5T42_11755 [Microbacterium sp. 4R-513]